MKPFAIIMLLVAVSAYADENPGKDCVTAVDAADSMNVNQKDCDYSDEGLNGFLQKAFKKGDDGAVLETNTKSEKNNTAEKNSTTVKNPSVLQANKVTATNENVFTLSVEIDQWANLPLARGRLLPKALERCGEGFAIVGEHYRSLKLGRIELELSFLCDK
ncbi:hypothetical protein [Cellvibrio mixtus]|uniref:hypothetical protein n=1 Tax=Cellvibrio mixtus TaxID=39650 RepID=UPI00058734A6|nr:hypothetical protein [Cellvibrio mixtus]